MSGELLVLVETRNGEVADITWEILSMARGIGGPVTALLPGHRLDHSAAMLAGAADTVLLVDDPALAEPDLEPTLAVLAAAVRQRRPGLVLVGHTARGMEIGPAAALDLGLPYLADCTAARSSDGVWQMQRQVYGGRLQATATLKPVETALLSVRPGATAVGDPSRQGMVENLACPSLTEPRRRHLGFLSAELEDLDIAEAEVLVAVGRGVGKPDNIAEVEAFAETIGATLACSRPVADAGWLPKSRQVGTSGKAVQPRLYIALGISGAFQHEAGMRNAGTIIAVNTDPRAPIFGVAHYGIVADLFEVLPLLTAKLSRD